MKRCWKLNIVLPAVLMVVLSAPLPAAPQGALTPEAIKQIRQSFKMNARTRAMLNAITNNDITSLALNREILQRHNEIFSHEIKTKGITNQKQSGRCWLFAGLNILRPIVTKKCKLKDFEFSESYLAFWDKMEKANCFLERIIKFADRDVMDREMELILRDPITDGGYWEGVVNLIEKYGVVPKVIMPETHSSENTSLMNKLLARKLRADAVTLRKMHHNGKSIEELRARKVRMLDEIYKMLVMNFGEPPTEFQWRFEDSNSVVSPMKTYTPKSFYKKLVGIDLGQYVDLFNDPSKKYDKHYVLSTSKNVYDGNDVNFANIKIKTLKDIAVKSVLGNDRVWFACDVGKDQNKEHGIMAMDLYDYDSIYGVRMNMTKAQRALFRESVPNHAMALIGVDIQNDKPVKWLVENSWGKDKGSAGRWTLYDTWFDMNVYSIIVKKKYVPEEVLKILKQPPQVLPPWDPMFAFVH
jgi:bleomycin hydrolase